MSKIKAIFFDLDGTLIDSKYEVVQSINQIRKDFNLNPLSEEKVLENIGNGTKYLLKASLEQDNITDEIYNKFLDYYKSNSREYSKVFEGVEELLTKLKDYKKVLITNKSYPVTCEVVDKLFKNTFDLVFGGDSLPERKPSPYPINYAMKQLELLPSEVVFFGDSTVDYEAAISANVECILAKYGYEKEEDLLNCKKAKFIDKPLDLINLLRSDSIENIIGDTTLFLDKIFNELKILNIDISNRFLDHLCYRVATLEEYNHKKEALLNFGVLLTEADVNGRPIATFKLTKPIVYNSREIFLIELPSPKKNTNYESGLEHIEFVIEEGLSYWIEKYPKIDFEKSGMSKELNPEIKIALSDNLAVKFHPLSLDKVIEIESRE
ncbi:MAG: VOC family protein [Candidatus Sericytochromatia bacterium]